MVAILTGDVINSRSASSPEQWLAVLKESLKTEPKHEIFRGDSFQLETAPENSLWRAIYIKACMKAIKGLDVRIAIGIGSKDFSAPNISESNGQAFVFSGEKFEDLKKEKSNLAIKTAWSDFDEEVNLLLRLALIPMNDWTQVSSQAVKLAMENRGLSQSGLAEVAKKSQSSVSEALKRAHFSDILELESLYRKKLIKQINPDEHPPA